MGTLEADLEIVKGFAVEARARYDPPRSGEPAE